MPGCAGAGSMRIGAPSFSAISTDSRPSANLPEQKAGRWGAGLTVAKMAECRWVKPVQREKAATYNTGAAV